VRAGWRAGRRAGNLNNDIAIATTGRRGRRKGRGRKRRRPRRNGRIRGRIGIGGRGDRKGGRRRRPRGTRRRRRAKERGSLFILYFFLLRNLRLGNYSTVGFNIRTKLNDRKEGNSNSNEKHNGRLTFNSFHMFHEGGTIKGKDFRVILNNAFFDRNTTYYGL
jgi:hypothetical protein